jgi:hypothetical protein
MNKQMPPDLTRAPTESERTIDRGAAHVSDEPWGGRVSDAASSRPGSL